MFNRINEIIEDSIDFINFHNWEQCQKTATHVTLARVALKGLSYAFKISVQQIVGRRCEGDHQSSFPSFIVILPCILWNHLFKMCRLSWCLCSSLADFGRSLEVGAISRMLFIDVEVYPIPLWSIWKERNDRIFRNSSSSADDLFP